MKTPAGAPRPPTHCTPSPPAPLAPGRASPASGRVSRAPRRSPPSAEAYRWVRPSCRNPSRKAAPLPCRQLPAPSSRGAQGQESASGRRRKDLRAVLRRPRAGEPSALLQARASVAITELTAGRRGPCTPPVSPPKVRQRPGFRPDLPPLTRMLWTGLPATFYVVVIVVIFFFRFHLSSSPSSALLGGARGCALRSLARLCSWAAFAATPFPESPLG